MALYQPTERIKAGPFFPAAMLLPVGASESAFEDGLHNSGVRWYEIEALPMGKFQRRVGYLQALKDDITPLLITQSLTLSPGTVYVVVDKTPVPMSMAASMAVYLGFTGPGVLHEIWDFVFSEDVEPIRWLRPDELFGLSAQRIVHVMWRKAVPTREVAEALLAPLGIINIASKFELVKSYAGEGTTVIEMWLSSGEDINVSVEQIRKALYADEIRVSTEAQWTGTGAWVVQKSEAFSHIVTGLIDTTSGVTEAVLGFVKQVVKDKDSLGLWVKVIGGISLGIGAVWAISKVVGWGRAR